MFKFAMGMLVGAAVFAAGQRVDAMFAPEPPPHEESFAFLTKFDEELVRNLVARGYCVETTPVTGEEDDPDTIWLTHSCEYGAREPILGHP